MQAVARALGLTLLCACGPAEVDPCAGPDALMACSAPAWPEAHYVEQAHAYFDTMDYEPVGTALPDYGLTVARWEWPPWLALTAFGRDDIHDADALLVFLPSVVKERDCRAFDTQPFARCRVVFYYDAHEGRSCPIYEEFAFNEAGQITWIEAWSDDPGFGFGEQDEAGRLSARIPGLGSADGRIDPRSEAMAAAAAADADVAHFAESALDWHAAWLEAFNASGGDLMWETGCGW